MQAAGSVYSRASRAYRRYTVLQLVTARGIYLFQAACVMLVRFRSLSLCLSFSLPVPPHLSLRETATLRYSISFGALVLCPFREQQAIEQGPPVCSLAFTATLKILANAISLLSCSSHQGRAIFIQVALYALRHVQRTAPSNPGENAGTEVMKSEEPCLAWGAGKNLDKKTHQPRRVVYGSTGGNEIDPRRCEAPFLRYVLTWRLPVVYLSVSCATVLMYQTKGRRRAVSFGHAVVCTTKGKQFRAQNIRPARHREDRGDSCCYTVSHSI